jgi:ABC-type sugar transport system permease subunit
MATPKMEFVGLANYAQAWNAPVFWEVLRNNLLFAAGTVPCTLGLALALAVLINQKIRSLALYRVFLFYPTMIPMAAAAMIWLWILTPNYGLLNYYGRWFGLPDIHWLGDNKLAIWALVLVGVWKRVGYYMVIYLAGLQVIPEYLYEAARIEGAGPWQRFWKVTFPLVSPTTFFVAVMVVIDSFQAIDQVYLMTGGGPGHSTNLFIFYIYQNAFRFFDFGYASAISAILFLILLGLTVLAFRTLHRKVHYA